MPSEVTLGHHRAAKSHPGVPEAPRGCHSRHNDIVSSATTELSTPHLSVNRPNLAQVGTIVWLSSELMFFAGLFAMYFTHRSVAGPEVWAEGAGQLNLLFSGANTLVLVLSSVTCQMGVIAAERLQARRSAGVFAFWKWGMNEWFILTYLMGAFFVAGQIFEYAELAQHGLTFQNSTYGSVFYLTTGFHGLHVIGGLIAFLFVLLRSFSAKRFGEHEATTAIVVSYYWHFVDAVWIALFFTIYFLQ